MKNLLPNKRIVFILMVASLTIKSNAQLKIGAIAGINLSTLSGDFPENGTYSTKAGSNFAAFIDVKLSKSVALSFQPSFSQEGTKIAYKIAGFYNAVDSLKINLNYFSLPIIFKIHTPSNRFYGIAGFDVSKLLNSSITFIESNSETDIQEEIANWNFNMHFGAGFRYPIGKTFLFFEARYTQGLSNLTTDPIRQDFIPRVKTSNFKILTGIEIPLNLK